MLDDLGPLFGVPELSIGEIVAGKYQIVAFVSRGGIGSVYRAIQLSIKREVALKILRPTTAMSEADPGFAERFRREAETGGRLRHPNTVTVFDFGEHVTAVNGLPKRTCFIAMEYVHGWTLRDVLKEEGRFTPDRAIGVTLQILRSLREAHALRIVHRDLKPANIMLAGTDEGEQVKVLDFGVAKVTEPGRELTQAGALLGSPPYMSPEQIRLEEVDGRADIYAIGCILFEMLAGAPPYQASGMLEICSAHLMRPVPSLDEVAGVKLGVPIALEAIVRRCLEKEPEDRYPSVVELARALNEIGGESDPGAIWSIDPGRRTHRPRPRQGSPLAWLVAGLLIAGSPTLLLATVGLSVMVATRFGGAPAASGQASAEPPEEGPPPLVEPAPVWILRSDPPGARVLMDGVEIGITPLELVRLPERGRSLVIRREGYRDETVDREEIEAGSAVSLLPEPSPGER